MIGTVIEGRYVGASVNKLSDRNILYIQTEDGTKVTFSKNNTISIVYINNAPHFSVQQ